MICSYPVKGLVAKTNIYYKCDKSISIRNFVLGVAIAAMTIAAGSGPA